MFFSFLSSAVRMGVAFLFGSTGETITEKSGHLNLGVPGIMCVGAAAGVVSEVKYAEAVGGNLNPVLAVIIPILFSFLAGALFGLLYSFFTVSLRSNQNVTGLVITTFGIGLADTLIAGVSGGTGACNRASKFFTASLPFADNLGWFGKLFLSYGVMVYLGVILSLLAWFVLKYTRVGLHLRAVGENPATADAAGINVTAYRYFATIIGCGISALGGLSYVMDTMQGNWEYVIDGIGWLSIALVIFTVWKPNMGIIGSVVFGALYIASSYITGVPFLQKPVLKMLPYVVTVIVLIITSIIGKRENQPPMSLGTNYYREER